MLVIPIVPTKAVLMRPATDLRFEWVTDPNSFLELRDQWNLLGSSAIETVFFMHAWLAAWLEELAPDAELHVLTAWDADRLVAALPLYGSQDAGRGRRWAFMGTGTLTPNHLDVIAEPEVLEQVRTRFVGLLLDESENWDVLEFDKLPADSETAQALDAAFARRGIATSCSVSAVCPYCDLPATFEEYVATRKRDLRKEMRQKRRRFAAEPDKYKLAFADTEEGALSALERLEAIHQARWQGKGYPGAFADPRVVAFHAKVVRAAVAAGYLRTYTLSIDGQVAAVSYNFRIGSTVQGYLSSFDARWADESPGVALRSYVIERAIAEGVTRYDFLEGSEHYKFAWCTDARENLRVRVFNRSVAGQVSRLRHAANETTVRLARRWVPRELRESVVKTMARRGASRSSDSSDS